MPKSYPSEVAMFLKKFTSAVTTTALISIFTVGCSQGAFESIAGSNMPPGQTGQGDGAVTPTPKEPTAFDKLELSGQVSGTSYDKDTVLQLDKENLALLLYLSLPIGLPFSDIAIDVPEARGVKIRTVLDNQQKARLQVSIPLRLLFKDKLTLAPAGTLPDGRALPMMPSGEYPSLGLSLFPNTSKNVHLYFGVNAVGLFFRSSFFPEYLSITTPIKNASETRTLGYFTIVPKKGNSDGGLFLSLILPNDIAAIIDDHLSGIIN